MDSLRADGSVSATMGAMTVSDSARRRPRAFWNDARFFLGIALIAASVAGVWFVVAAARQTTPVYAVTRTVVSGETVTASDIRQVDVALGSASDAYLSAAVPAEGMVATRTLPAGELVPQDALQTRADAETTVVVLRSAVEVPASVQKGSVVEVWSAAQVERGVYDTPRVLVDDATVVSVSRDDSMIGGGGVLLEVLVPRSDVAAALAAMTDQSALSVVPASGSGR